VKGAMAIDKPAIDRRQFTIGGIAAGAPAEPRLARAQGERAKIRRGWVVVPASTAPLPLVHGRSSGEAIGVMATLLITGCAVSR
jgi:hypothetical protein